jgi:ATP-dependent DNA ligase
MSGKQVFEVPGLNDPSQPAAMNEAVPRRIDGRSIAENIPKGLAGTFTSPSPRSDWVRLKLVAQIEFLEQIESDHLRHSKFVRLREDKDARSVIKEHAGES